jgi:hypothetical protein
VANANYEWILTERVTGEPRGSGIWVKEADGERTAFLRVVESGALLFDMAYVDVGDDLVSYLSVMDEIQEQGWSEPDKDEDLRPGPVNWDDTWGLVEGRGE